MALPRVLLQHGGLAPVKVRTNAASTAAQFRFARLLLRRFAEHASDDTLVCEHKGGMSCF